MAKTGLVLNLVCGLYGQNHPYKFKKLHGDFQNRTVRKITYIENYLWDYWSPVRSETGFVILSKFWSS